MNSKDNNNKPDTKDDLNLQVCDNLSKELPNFVSSNFLNSKPIPSEIKAKFEGKNISSETLKFFK